MAASSSLQFSLDPCILADLNTIGTLCIADLDDFAIENGTLKVVKGSFFQGVSSTGKNIFYGGHNCDEVSTYLENLAIKVSKAFENLESLKENKEVFEYETYGILKGYKRTLKTTVTIIGELHKAYAERAPSSVLTRMGNLQAQLNLIFRGLTDFLAKNRVDSYKSEPKPIDLTVPVRFRSPMFKIPKGTTPKDVVSLFWSAKAQTTGPVQSIGMGTIWNLGLIAGSAVSVPLTLVKWAVWNPIELGKKGYIETQNPTTWFVDHFSKLKESNVVVTPDILLESYVTSVLRVPVVTDEHVDAFCEMVPHISFSPGNQFCLFQNYQIISSNPEELIQFLPQTLNNPDPHFDYMVFGSKVLEVLSNLIGNIPEKYMTAQRFANYVKIYFPLFKWIENPEWEDPSGRQDFEKIRQKFTGQTAEERKNHLLMNLPVLKSEEHSKYVTYITLQNLLRIVEAAAANPTWTEFSPSSMPTLPSLHEKLLRCGFKAYIEPYSVHYSRSSIL